MRYDTQQYDNDLVVFKWVVVDTDTGADGLVAEICYCEHEWQAQKICNALNK